MLLRPVRTLMLLGAAFIAGIVYEKANHAEACAENPAACHRGERDV